MNLQNESGMAVSSCRFFAYLRAGWDSGRRLWKKCEKILTAFPILCYNKNAEGCSRNLLKRCFFLGLV
jgi:hypothetical protein